MFPIILYILIHAYAGLWAIAATRFRGLADRPSCSECLQSDPAIAVAETVKDQLVVEHSLERGRHACARISRKVGVSRPLHTCHFKGGYHSIDSFAWSSISEISAW